MHSIAGCFVGGVLFAVFETSVDVSVWSRTGIGDKQEDFGYSCHRA